MLWAIGVNPVFLKHVNFNYNPPRVKSGIACTQVIDKDYTPFVMKDDRFDNLLVNGCTLASIFYKEVLDIREHDGRVFILVERFFPEDKTYLFEGLMEYDDDPYLLLASMLSEPLTQLNVQRYSERGDGVGITHTVRYEGMLEMEEPVFEATHVYPDITDLGKFGCICFTFTSRVEQEIISDGIESDIMYRIYNANDLTNGEEIDIFADVLRLSHCIDSGNLEPFYANRARILKASENLNKMNSKRQRNKSRWRSVK